MLLVDDDPRFRAVLEALLRDRCGIEEVTEASDGRRALALLPRSELDLALVDLTMPGLSGLGLTRAARARQPGLPVVIVTLHRDRALVEAAREAGASGYLLKDRVHDELPRALEAVARGEVYLDPAVRPG